MLGLFTSLKAILRPGGKVVLTGRIVSGMEQHADDWPGSVEMFCEYANEGEEDNLDRALSGDNREYKISELPFRLHLVDFQSEELKKHLARLKVAIVALGYRTTHLSAWGQEVSTPVVYVTEYTLKTRLQIAAAVEQNPIKRAKRIAWETRLESLRVAALVKAAGVQCNGAPTFSQYKRINRAPMLFFDNRLTERELITQEEIEARLGDYRSPLRLVFLGRLNKMKGADHLPEIAQSLRKRGVEFRLDIFGGGVWEQELRAQIERRSLQEQVRIQGFKDLKTELLPHLKQNAEIFLCPHVQGDPAMAYLESLGAGLAIVGYRNEALGGLLEFAKVGADVPIGSVEGIAEKLTSLYVDRAPLKIWAQNAVTFARRHLFAKSFQRRMRHVVAVAELADIRAFRDPPERPRAEKAKGEAAAVSPNIASHKNGVEKLA